MTETQRTTEEVVHLVDCPKCGHSNLPDERYCANCGALMTGAKASPKAPPPEDRPGLLGKLFGKKR